MGAQRAVAPFERLGPAPVCDQPLLVPLVGLPLHGALHDTADRIEMLVREHLRHDQIAIFLIALSFIGAQHLRRLALRTVLDIHR